MARDAFPGYDEPVNIGADLKRSEGFVTGVRSEPKAGPIDDIPVRIRLRRHQGQGA
jgi:hypothetical protein